MEEVTTVVLGLEEPEVAEEVMHFLDRSGGSRVVATASDGRQLSEAIRQLEPDAVIASPAVVVGAGLRDSVFLALETAESVRALREAIRAGARGFFIWPGDRDALAGAAAGLARRLPDASTSKGSVWTVFGPRGGAGTTFVATHLASALLDDDTRPLLIDLDLAFADLTHALGVPADREPRTLADLVPVIAELLPKHLEEAAWHHPSGLRALLAPVDLSVSEALDGTAVVEILDRARSVSGRVIVHVPRGLDAAARAALGNSERVVLVLHPDVLAVRGARRAMEQMGLRDRAVAAVTASRRGEFAVSDIEKLLGCPVVVIPSDPAVPEAQDRGELVPLRGRTGKAFSRLVEVLEGGAA